MTALNPLPNMFGKVTKALKIGSKTKLIRAFPKKVGTIFIDGKRSHTRRPMN
jgi:hypothetical protein